MPLYREDKLLNQYRHSAVTDSSHEAGEKHNAVIENKRLALLGHSAGKEPCIVDNYNES